MTPDLGTVTDRLVADLERLQFSAPVAHVYNPLVYAREPYDRYLERYGTPPKEVVLVGMNPGPWGMTQTGVPFGEVNAVRGWLEIEGRVERPPAEHPKRPIQGFACRRSEVSGRRVWGWARRRCGSADRFFARYFVANYCPLLFLTDSGRNLTPDQLPAADRAPLLAVCDQALRATLTYLQARYVVGIGRFAAGRVAAVGADGPFVLGRITHPSPANPAANRDWDALIEGELRALGVPPPCA